MNTFASHAVKDEETFGYNNVFGRGKRVGKLELISIRWRWLLEVMPAILPNWKIYFLSNVENQDRSSAYIIRKRSDIRFWRRIEIEMRKAWECRCFWAVLCGIQICKWSRWKLDTENGGSFKDVVTHIIFSHFWMKKRVIYCRAECRRFK